MKSEIEILTEILGGEWYYDNTPNDDGALVFRRRDRTMAAGVVHDFGNPGGNKRYAEVWTGAKRTSAYGISSNEAIEKAARRSAAAMEAA